MKTNEDRASLIAFIKACDAFFEKVDFSKYADEELLELKKKIEISTDRMPSNEP